jgi:hypothetical protein
MKIKLSKSQWQLIGKKTGWLKTAQLTPEEEVEENKALASLDNLDIEVDEGETTSEKVTHLEWSYQRENTYDRPTGENIDSKNYTMKISGIVYYPDLLQKKYGNIQKFVTGYEDGWKDDLITKEKIKDINWDSFQLDNFKSEKIDDNNYQVLAEYSFVTESEPYFPEREYTGEENI